MHSLFLLKVWAFSARLILQDYPITFRRQNHRHRPQLWITEFDIWNVTSSPSSKPVIVCERRRWFVWFCVIDGDFPAVMRDKGPTVFILKERKWICVCYWQRERKWGIKWEEWDIFSERCRITDLPLFVIFCFYLCRWMKTKWMVGIL